MKRRSVDVMLLALLLTGLSILLVRTALPPIQRPMEILGFASASDYVNVSQAKQMIESNPGLVILDVRSQAEYDSGHLQNATLIPSTELASRLGELDNQKDILVYCASGGRSATASQTLVDNGFPYVYNMLGGITAWKNAGYWTEVVHNGDLVIGGTQTFTIENCTYAQKGNVFVSDSARVIIRNAIFRIGPQDYWHQFDFSVSDQVRLDISDSELAAPQGAWLDCGGDSRVNIIESSISGMPMAAWGSSYVIINSTNYVGRQLALSGNFRMTILNSTIEEIALNLEASASHRIEGLRPGYFDYLDLHQNQSQANTGYELTIANSSVRNWRLTLPKYDVNVVVSNSALNSICIWYARTTTQIDGVKDGRYYEQLEINNLGLTNTSVSSFIFAVRDSRVELRDTTALLHLFGGFSNVSIYDSDLDLFSRGDGGNAVGVLLLNHTSFRLRGLAYSELYIGGNITHIEMTGTDWFRSNVTRNYNVIARDTYGDFVENAEMTMFDLNGTVVWSGQADSSGNTDFNVTFTDSNYTDPLRLEAVKDGASVTQSVSFLSSTPVMLHMLTHDIAMANVTAYKTFVCQGCDALFNVTVTNQGDTPETFNFTVYANDTVIETHTVTYLLSGLKRSTTFTWNTTGLAYGNYTISAVASPLPIETDTADNNYTCWVTITLVGDITGQGGNPDWNVDMKDVSYAARRFLCLQSDPLWDSNADTNGDGKIDMKDISTVARHFGEHYP